VAHFGGQESRYERNFAVVFSFFLAAILLAGVGCSKKPNDAQVSTDVQNKFSQDSGLSDKQLTVQASNEW